MNISGLNAPVEVGVGLLATLSFPYAAAQCSDVHSNAARPGRRRAGPPRMPPAARVADPSTHPSTHPSMHACKAARRVAT